MPQPEWTPMPVGPFWCRRCSDVGHTCSSSSKSTRSYMCSARRHFRTCPSQQGQGFACRCGAVTTRGKFRRPWFPPTEKKADKCSLRVVRKSTARVQPSCPPPLSTGLHPAALTALLGDGRLDGDTALKERRVLLQGLHEVAVVAGEGDGP